MIGKGLRKDAAEECANDYLSLACFIVSVFSQMFMVKCISIKFQHFWFYLEKFHSFLVILFINKKCLYLIQLVLKEGSNFYSDTSLDRRYLLINVIKYELSHIYYMGTSNSNVVDIFLIFFLIVRCLFITPQDTNLSSLISSL